MFYRRRHVCSFQSVHPSTTVDRVLLECTNALSKQHVVWMQIPAEIEDLHSSSICAVHLKVCDHASTDGTMLCCQTLGLNLVPQIEHVIHALLQLALPCRLPLADVAAKVAIRDRLYTLCQSQHLLQLLLMMLLDTMTSAAFFMRVGSDGQTIVGFRVRV